MRSACKIVAAVAGVGSMLLLFSARPEPSRAGAATDGFTLQVFPIDSPGVTPYNAAMVSALDHSGAFYTQCCDTTITAFTGEAVTRGGGQEFGCPAQPVFPECFFTANCICSYGDPEGDPFIVNGNYTGAFGSDVLLYDGHAGYDYGYGFDTALVATRGGQLCKAFRDEVNGQLGANSAWEAFHTFYIDHGTFGETGYASWYLHASDLDGVDMTGNPLTNLGVAGCAPVEDGQLVARVGNTGTFLPHLHFEVRVYDPLFGPEEFPQVIDPYGWTGAGPDPWSQGTNNQAVSRLRPVWAVPEADPGLLALAALATLVALRRYRLPFALS